MLFRKKKQQDQAEMPENSGPMNASGPVEQTGAAAISGDIVAAITAAIAAASGLSTSAFRIASISTSEYGGGFNTPIWGRVERLTRKQV